MSPAPIDIVAAAEKWYRNQLQALERHHGARWHEHRAWIDDYLREFIRQRLLASGWRHK